MTQFRDNLERNRARLRGKKYMLGEKHPNAKLTAQQVRDIRKDRRPYRAIAAQYKISCSQVSDIKNGRAWVSVK